MDRRLTLTRWLTLACCAAICGCGKSGGSGNPEAAADPLPKTEIGSAVHTDPNPTVVLRTSQGNIKLRLDATKAPMAVDNFLSQVSSGFYDQTIFHQVEPGYVAVAGGFRADLTEKVSRYNITNEAANGLSNRRGTIAMTRSMEDIQSSTGQFFINLSDNAALDHRGTTPEDYGFCVFGEVVEGMDVVEKIAKLPTRKTAEFEHLPVETVVIESATRLR